MPRAVDLLEYEMPLGTGEVIHVAEADPGRSPAFSDPAVASACAEVLVRCTSVPRDVIEEAKIGGTSRLESLLGTPPHGCLLRMPRPVCGEIGSCVLADRRRCDASRRGPSGPDFPLCWTYPVRPGLPEAVAAAARDVADSVVAAWREGRYVLLVRDS